MAEVPGSWLVASGLLLLFLLVAVIVLAVFVAIAMRQSFRCAHRGRNGQRGCRGVTGPEGEAGVSGTATNTGAGGPTGADGAEGPTGPEGVAGTATNTGAAGPTGPTGAAGTPGPESMIPFASSIPVTLTTVLGGTGLADLGAVIGFGGSISSIDVSGLTIDLAGTPGQAINEAFNASRDGTITSISATYSNVLALALGLGTATVNVQLYHAAATSNVFSPLSGVVASIPLTGTLVLGTTGADLVTGLSVPVVAGDRYLLVAFVTTDDVFVAISANGYISAGVGIA